MYQYRGFTVTHTNGERNEVIVRFPNGLFEGSYANEQEAEAEIDYLLVEEYTEDDD